MSGWRFWIDRGGTFTDVIGLRPDGELVTHKLLSERPQAYGDAACQGVRDLLGLGEGPIPEGLVESVTMGTTVATNALLERRGAPTALAITAGFGDALRIAHQDRPRIFDRRIVLPTPLYERVVEAPERVSAAGEVVEALDEAAVRARLTQARDEGCEALAVVLMHGYRYAEHERRIAQIARELGFAQVSTSHETLPLMKLVGRGDTTVVDAYLSPILARYVAQVAGALGPHVPLAFMQSNGGLAAASVFRGKDAVLSGPAGGVVGISHVARRAGFEKVIGFDMGGTSTDVSHFAGEYERTQESMVAGVRIRAPMMDIHTVAAGGGSICRFDGERMRVGPASAGASPGPAGYGRGGPLTVTDCNVLLGKLQPDFLPALFGETGDRGLDIEAVRAGFADLAAQTAMDPLSLAEGFLEIAVQNMANAIKRVSTARGRDLAEYALVCFGGAAGQHACLVADALGMQRVLIHPLAGVLSAYGIGLADHRAIRQQSVETPLDQALAARLEDDLGRLEASGRAEASDAARCDRRARLKYAGTDTAIEVAFGPSDAMRADFEAAYRRQFGFVTPGAAIVVESIAVETIDPPAAVSARLAAPRDGPDALPLRTAAVRMDGAERQARVYRRDDLARGQTINGPALIVETTATTVIEPGWSGRMTERGDLVLTREAAARPPRLDARRADPARLEVFANLFMSIAEQMGAALRNTARSVNIKERLDFSCAIFDRHGSLVANAPHMPVHLGSMGESVRSALWGGGWPEGPLVARPGDVIAQNDPYHGGTHLPDITVVTPVFDKAGHLAYALAARGHHADVGGVTPGSMPPASRTLAEEGVLFDNVRIIEDGVFQEDAVREVLCGGRFPARDPDQNVADLKAQAAACAKGAQALANACSHYGDEVVAAYMGFVQDNAAACVRAMLATLDDGAFRCEADDGWVIEVAIRKDRATGRAVFDFTGSSAQVATNFNAPASVGRAAVLYALRALVDDDIPMNDGCLRSVDIVIPEGSILSPRRPAAVVAGNVETSQLVTDAVFGASGRLAASQGTMNNFTFGDAARQYYETICGGAGAGPGFDGADAVQTHMTNSRLTDPEVLETRFPVLVERFAIRHGSGGRGRWRGGDGVARRIRFLAPMTASILANRRRVAPFGLAGGEPGATGANRVIRATGETVELPATAAVEMRPGDVFEIETPGGGGYGAP